MQSCCLKHAHMYPLGNRLIWKIKGKTLKERNKCKSNMKALLYNAISPDSYMNFKFYVCVCAYVYKNMIAIIVIIIILWWWWWFPARWNMIQPYCSWIYVLASIKYVCNMKFYRIIITVTIKKSHPSGYVRFPFSATV